MKKTAIILLLWMTLLTGFIYPLLVSIIAAIAMPHKSSGSLVTADGKTVGSHLIAQKFISDKYFWPRPSAVDYNPLPSGGSNLGPTDLKLKDEVKQRMDQLMKAHGGTDKNPIPSDLLYASGSGLDPHISIAAAYYQMERVAQARKLDETTLKNLIDKLSNRHYSFFAPVTVNVLELNLALDQIKAVP